jgi:hypothetical protein
MASGMSGLTDLLERAMHDLRHGWPEAAYDALGRAVRIAEVLEAQNLAARVEALEKRSAGTKLAELNEFRSSESRKLDEAIKSILEVHPGCWLNAKHVQAVLRQAAFHPLPAERTVRLHLRKIRGKRHDTVAAHIAASAPTASP